MSGHIDYKITMKPQCIPWISAPLPPVARGGVGAEEGFPVSTETSGGGDV